MADGRANQKEHAVGHEQADGCAQLGESAKPSAFAFRRVFRGDQCRAAPFAAQAQALAEAEQAQQQRRENADLLVIGQQADGDGGQTHGQQ